VNDKRVPASAIIANVLLLFTTITVFITFYCKSSEVVRTLIFSTLAVLLTLLLSLEIILRKSNRYVKARDSDTPNKKVGGECQLEIDNFKLRESPGYSANWRDRKINFSSQTVNIVDGWRTTTDQPINATNSIHLFGGSTIQCSEVSDAETISSHLQRLLNSSNLLYKVENFGTSGARVRANFIELQQIEVKPGDFVIVYFGVNDAKVNNFFQKATRPLNLWPGYIQLLGFLRIKLNLQVANWIWLETVQPDFDRQLNRSKVGAETLLADLMKIHCFSEQTGSKFIAILQPHIFTKRTSDTFETNQKKKYASSLEKVISLQYKAYLSSFSGFGWFQDFRHAFDTLDESPYLDWVHVNSSGNQRIAEEIFELVSKKD